MKNETAIRYNLGEIDFLNYEANEASAHDEECGLSDEEHTDLEEQYDREFPSV